MKVNGSGGSFVEQVYHLTPAVAWELGLQVCREMEVDIEKQDDAGMLLNGSLVSEEKSFLFGKPQRSPNGRRSFLRYRLWKRDARSSWTSIKSAWKSTA